ncbi:flavodoxin-dependent (E)-4-hydroxy-3-methylbut-2-enyl-diphosphate synthase [Thermosulfurimonas sp. F29]|uniref:flavodoxin-dependent (E)-4-hydroxy-3-methylbut-2-enyl-diphosphate synthase n=1 Tax=Thermosulfurimonas sp. F29 TaxID=2867247 RepID=UPI001C82CD27|nr:flavodoxin-dependent (E)-4-hydroxy-3-methylbut-2-enyl-diphosphate synthase [Thermosulfurimonas sp. F29]
MSMNRRRTREIRVGWVRIGGDNPVVVQSMTNTDTRDVEATVAQIRELEEEGCEVIRVAVPDEAAAEAVARIVSRINIPLIADIHFDWRLAVSALRAGAHGVRINPGNIKGRENVRRIIEEARARGACVRIGVNAGSLERDLLRKYGWPRPEALVESALRWLDFVVGDLGFENVKVSLKSSDLWHTVAAYREFSRRSDFPVHIGVTEAGGLIPGTVKSALGLGILLSEGIGDTLRVSLTAPPVEEVRVAWEILKAVGVRRRGLEIVACPTCGRCEIDLMGLYEEVERRVRGIRVPLRIAVMGCVVNGPGEAREADLGLAGGKGVGLIFRRGKIVRKVPEAQLLEAFWEELQRLLREESGSGEIRGLTSRSGELN